MRFHVPKDLTPTEITDISEHVGPDGSRFIVGTVEDNRRIFVMGVVEPHTALLLAEALKEAANKMIH